MISGLGEPSEPAQSEALESADHAGAPESGPTIDQDVDPSPERSAPETPSSETSEPEPETLSPALDPAPAIEPAPVVEPVAAAEPAPAPEPAPVVEPVAAAEPALTPAPAPEPGSKPTIGQRAEPGSIDIPQRPAPPPGGPTPSAPPPSPPPSGRPTTPPPTGTPSPKQPQATGKIVEGIVTAVTDESVELTLDDGREAVIHRRNFSLQDDDPSTVLSVGDRAFGAELAREDPKARVVLSRAWALKKQAWDKALHAAQNNEVLNARVVSASKKGLVVDVGVRGFVPSSHLELTTVTDTAPYIDQVLEVKVLEVDPRREKLVLSRRSLLLRQQRKQVQEMLSALKPGEVRTGKVSSLTDYGAFVDIGGASGLVHISELSWHRVSKPADVVGVGDEVEVKVLDVKPKKKRISLSIRQITPDPLESIEVGAVLFGPVTRLVDFGAFVAVGGFEGLVHLSELAEYRVSTPGEIVAPGDEVGVKVLSVDTKRRRIELSIRRAAEYEG